MNEQLPALLQVYQAANLLELSRVQTTRLFSHLHGIVPATNTRRVSLLYAEGLKKHRRYTSYAQVALAAEEFASTRSAREVIKLTESQLDDAVTQRA